MSRITRWRVRKGLSPGIGRAYHTSTMAPDDPGLDVEWLKGRATVVAISYITSRGALHPSWDLIQDLAQEAILRVYEIGKIIANIPAGIERKRYATRVMKNSIRSFIQREKSQKTLAFSDVNVHFG